MVAADDVASLARRAIEAGPGNLCVAVSADVSSELVAGALVRLVVEHASMVMRWREYDSVERVAGKAQSGAGTIGLAIAPDGWAP